MFFFFETHGCQMNSAESAALALAAREEGWEAAADSSAADLVLINTCSVRKTAETRLYGRLAHYAAEKKRRQAEGRAFALVVAGCMAERLGEELKREVPAVDYVMGTQARSRFPLILKAVEETLQNGAPGAFPALDAGDEKPVFSFSASHLAEGTSPVRSFVPIMHGCNNFCSYCIVPYVRGREISRDPALILEEIRLLSEKGIREITLLGQNVNSYLCEGGERLEFSDLLELIARAIEGTPIKRLRFLSSHPKDFSEKTIKVMAEHPCFCRHLHLPVQHGSNRILSAMNRQYTREAYLDLVKRLRAAMPDLSLSTDILVGFPGETGEDLAETLALMEEVKFFYAYTYHYNPREGTRACDFPGRVEEKTKRERLSRVIALQKIHTASLLEKRIGRRERVLIEEISRKNADEVLGRTERDEMVVFPGNASMIGSFAELSLAALRGNTFFGKDLCLEVS
ncbi:MAG: tRNA (N6-isopentenyl adenosine(37)-C2)-methylthiotransferase MiaB [Treponema sp.]|nr:tRNA (N6-isopentenyl adenosine(37)-C2)-methylthiotransferase MiaB [Treponema sp.]